MQLLKQLQPGLHVANVAESVLQTSVFAVIFAAIVDRKTDTSAVQRRGRNRPTTTSKQAKAQNPLQQFSRTFPIASPQQVDNLHLSDGEVMGKRV